MLPYSERLSKDMSDMNHYSQSIQPSQAAFLRTDQPRHVDLKIRGWIQSDAFKV
jgi:hypothetical protein